MDMQMRTLLYAATMRSRLYARFNELIPCIIVIFFA